MDIMVKHLLLAALVLCLFVGCGSGGSTARPKTKDEFVSAFKTAYESGNEAAILNMVKWDGVPDDLRALVTFTLIPQSKNLEIQEINLIPFSQTGPVPGPQLPDAAPIKFNLQPKYWLVYKSTSSGEQPATWTARFHVGIENGEYFFCGPQHDKKK